MRHAGRGVLCAMALALCWATPTPTSAQRIFAGGEVSETAILAALSTAHPDAFRPVGTTAVVLQVQLTGDIDMAFKPESHLHPHGWLAEVAAFRIGRELGFDNVPPAALRDIERGRLRRRLHDDHIFDDVESDCVVRGSIIRGAAIYWVPGLTSSDLDSPDGVRRFRGWLSMGGAIPAEASVTARDLSNMILFDYLIGNRDRWSGGNVRVVAGDRVVIRDHNLAFPRRLDEAGHRRMLEHVMAIRRFSRSTLAALAALDESSLSAALEYDDEESGQTRTMLDAARIAGVLDRRDALVSYIGALIAEHGEADVLFFD